MHVIAIFDPLVKIKALSLRLKNDETCDVFAIGSHLGLGRYLIIQCVPDMVLSYDVDPWGVQVFATSLAMMLTPIASFIFFGYQPTLALLLGIAVSCTAVHVKGSVPFNIILFEIQPL